MSDKKAEIEELAKWLHEKLSAELFLGSWEEVPERNRGPMYSLAEKLLNEPPSVLVKAALAQDAEAAK